MKEKYCTNNSRNPDLDPIEWAIIGVIIAGGSLILSLEAKIEARKRAESKELELKAINSNKLKLGELKKYILELYTIHVHQKELGQVKIDEEKTGITKSYIEFESPEKQEIFNGNFDRITYLISRINRLVNDIDPAGFPIKDSDIKEYVTNPTELLKKQIELLITPDFHPLEREEGLGQLLNDMLGFVGGLDELLNKIS
jgi:hypothetical protein